MSTKQLLNFNVDIKAQEPEQRIISFRGSTGDVDRQNEVVEPKGWQLDNYAKNPVFLWGHDYSAQPIGKAVRVKKSKDGLDFDIKFATNEEYPFADTIYRLYKGGFIKSVSVGFIPVEWKDGDPARKEPSRTILKQELLELSAVSVPANPHALMNAFKGGVITDAELKDFEYEAAKEERYAQETVKELADEEKETKDAGSEIENKEGAPEAEKEVHQDAPAAAGTGKDACIIIDETEPEAQQKAEQTNAPTHKDTVMKAPEQAEYDRQKAFNRLVTWSGITEDKLPDLTDKGFSEQEKDMQDCLRKLGTGFAHVTESKMRYLHHDVEDGALVTNIKGVALAMKELLQDVYNGKIYLKDGEPVHRHLAEHYADFKRIAPSFNLFKLEAIKELFSTDTRALRETSYVPEEADENVDVNDADVLVAIMNGLETDGDIDEDAVALLEKVVHSNKEK